MEGTLLVRWEKGYEKKLAVVTNLPPSGANVAWYQMRFWIEDEYKNHKSGGWGWEQTKMTDPRRAQRLWLAMAVAMQTAVLVGGQIEAREHEQARKLRTERADRGRQGKPKHVGRPAKPIRRPRAREQSCLMGGQQAISAAVVRGETLPVGHVVGEAWPVSLYAVGKPPSSWVKKRKHKEERKRQRKSQRTQEHRQERARQREEKQAAQQAKREAKRQALDKHLAQWQGDQELPLESPLGWLPLQKQRALAAPFSKRESDPPLVRLRRGQLVPMVQPAVQETPP